MSTPADKVIAAAAKTIEVTDKISGKKITLSKPGVLAQFDFIEMLGPTRSVNAAYVQMAMPTLYVTAIDGEAVQQPTKYSELRALIQRLGDSGVATVALALEENFGEQKSPEEAKADLKKS